MTRKTCEAAKLGRQITALWGAFNEADAERNHRRMDEISDLIGSIEDRLAIAQATSIEGVMAQLGLIRSAADCVHSFTDGVKGHHKADQQHRQFERALYSAMSALEKISGTSRDEIGGGYYMSAKLDPRVSLGRAA